MADVLPRAHATAAVVGDVLQIDPAHDPVFGGCFLTVTEPKTWGAQGYVTVPGRGLAYYRAPWRVLVHIGAAEWRTPDNAASDEGAAEVSRG